MKHKKIAIIGGGYTGLTIARHMSKRGFDVTIFERESHIGGLATGCEIDGVALEKIWHFIYMTDSEVLDLARELGVHDRLSFHNSSISTYYDGVLYPFMTPKDLLTFTPLSLMDRIRTGIVGLYVQFLRDWRPLQNITAYAWMKKYAGARATKVIWEPLLRGKFGSYYDRVLMSWLWKRIKVRADSKEKTGEKLGYFTGGFGMLTDGMSREIVAHGGTIMCDAAVERILSNPDGTVTVERAGASEIYDAVVATVPTSVFGRLIADDEHVTPAYHAQLESIAYVGAIVMVFTSRQKISEYYWHNINDEKIPFLVFLSNSVLTGPEIYGGKNVYYVGFYAEHDHAYYGMDESEIMAEWERGLATVFPAFDPSEITDKKLYKFKNAQHIVDMGFAERIPSYHSVVPHVYLSNFSQIYPDDRGLNYAIKEGKKVAAIVEKDLMTKT